MQAEPPGTDSERYKAWKGWNSAFGEITAGDAEYFRRELRELNHAKIVDVLEIGFGNGKFLAFCVSQGWNVQGSELSPEQQAAGSQAGFVVHAAKSVRDLDDASFDLIAAFDVLEHIPESDSVEFLSTLRAKLRPGGSLLLRYPNADTWQGNAMQHGDPTHVTAIGYFKMEYLAVSAGLDIVSYRATRRRGFKTSAVHGVHALLAGPVIAVGAAVRKGLYFPGLPIVLSSSNVVCILSPSDGR